MKRVLPMICACVMWAAMPPASAVTGRILPLEPIAEPTELGHAFNFDILVRNDEPAALTLETLQMDFLDAGGGLLLRKEINGNGSTPSVQTIANRKLEPGEERLFFNPFPLVPGRLPVARVRARLEFSTPGDGAPLHSVDVAAVISTRGATLVALPLAGRIFVWDGHDALGHHRRWDYSIPFLKQIGFSSNGMRYSYDFVLVDAANDMSRPGAARNEDWFGFGTPVRAVEAGVVVKAAWGNPDDGSFDPQKSLEDINTLLGNYLVIEHDHGVFSTYAHLKQDSVRVRVGDRVRRGQVVAAVGNSGSSNFPHLHFQLMDAADMHGEGLPALFRDFERQQGSKRLRVTRGAIDTGEVVQSRRVPAPN